jgi:hypothetical protein
MSLWLTDGDDVPCRQSSRHLRLYVDTNVDAARLEARATRARQSWRGLRGEAVVVGFRGEGFAAAGAYAGVDLLV